MKDLKEYIKEGLFDIEDIEGKNSLEYNTKQLEKDIKDWICSHYRLRRSKMSEIKRSSLTVNTRTTPPTVNCSSDLYAHLLTSLNNNGMFQWGKVKGSFECTNCTKLESLEGAPKKVGSWVDCSFCSSLESLEGAPEEVGSFFLCNNCSSLKTLEGAPKIIGEWFDCSNCKSLKSLEGAPKEVGGYFNCTDCGTRFADEDVKKVSNVKGYIDC
jgi:hypothetical protein